ncbi:MAG: DUF4167 domain-containing protein [Micavibrio sp.]|nr:DUF4167 domain-containing protein [Micavibrio sp.]
MRNGTSNSRRQRGRNNNSGGRRNNNQRMQVFDSNGPDVRIRGTAFQVNEKYMALAKDAAAAGDRIMAESYLQHAEHYQRIINSWGEEVQAGQQNKSESVKENAGNTVKEDDLSLPASILTPTSKAVDGEHTSERTVEMAEE